MYITDNSTTVFTRQTVRNKIHLLAELVGWCIFNGFVAIMAIFGNLLVITAFTCFKKLRSVPFWMATRISIWLGSVSWMNNSLLYRSFIAVDVFSGIASIFHLLLISLQRLYAIAYPVRHRVSSTSSYLIAVAVTGLSHFLQPLHSFQEKLSYSWLDSSCYSFLVPLTLICIAYVTMFLLVKFQKHDCYSSNRHKEVKLILTVFLVILLFIAAWTPFMIINIMIFFCEKCSMPDKVVYFSKLFHYSNSAVNPAVYSHRMPEFKKAFYTLL